ncbi:MAG: hypothetical protein GF364_09240 [Candidatus Lokiarchaeota archaeon]|nr:hypothetical protein [Candidatus Lokiarchaeota archaeon]
MAVNLDKMRKKYMKVLFYYLISVGTIGTVLYIIYKINVNKEWIDIVMYLLIIFVIVAFILYICIYIKYRRKLDYY